MKDHVEFNNGQKMPIVGYGMWQSENPKELENGLDVALEAGYRHFDTAFSYGNEEVFGHVLKRWFETGKVKREDLFIVTKLPIQGTHPDRVEKFMKLSLERLQLDYVDLYLVHNPAGLKVDESGLEILFEDGKVKPDIAPIEDVWRAMEKQVADGRAKSIGLSNYSIAQIERIVKSAKIVPANLQVEMNVHYQKTPLIEACAKHGITICAFAPLGSPGRKTYYEATRPNDAHLKVLVPALLEEQVVVEIAKKHNVTPAQILLRFLAEKGIAVIPKSVTPARIKANIDIFSFSLDSDDTTKLQSLDTKTEGTWGFDWTCALVGLEDHPEFQLAIQTL